MGKINLGKVIPSNEIYQPKQDNGLRTNDKTIVGAINEVLNTANNASGSITDVTNQANAAKVVAQEATEKAVNAEKVANDAKSVANSALQKANVCLPLAGGVLTGSVTMSSGNLVGNPAGSISGYGKVYNAVWNDYAEFFERGCDTEPGDIIALDENSENEQYIKATKDSKCIVGVHSNTFAHLIGGEEPPSGEDYYEHNIKKFIPIGLAGRVYVKVIGLAEIGDYITISEISGVGVAIKPLDSINNCHVIGKILQNKNTEEIGLVKILIQ